MADVWVPNVGWTSPGSEYYPKPKQAAPTPQYEPVTRGGTTYLVEKGTVKQKEEPKQEAPKTEPAKPKQAVPTPQYYTDAAGKPLTGMPTFKGKPVYNPIADLISESAKKQVATRADPIRYTPTSTFSQGTMTTQSSMLLMPETKQEKEFKKIEASGRKQSEFAEGAVIGAGIGLAASASPFVAAGIGVYSAYELGKGFSQKGIVPTLQEMSSPAGLGMLVGGGVGGVAGGKLGLKIGPQRIRPESFPRISFEKVISGKITKTGEPVITSEFGGLIKRTTQKVVDTRQTEYTGLTISKGRESHPIIGKTDTGMSVGTPELSNDALIRISRTSDNPIKDITESGYSYIPSSPVETALVRKTIAKDLSKVDIEFSNNILELVSSTKGVKSKYMAKEIPFGEPLRRHGLKPETQENILKYFESKPDTIVYGSLAQKAQMIGNMERVVGDVDLKVASGEASVKELLGIIEKTEKKGTAFIPEGQPSLISTAKGHLFDIHPIDVAPVSGKGGRGISEYLYYGFKGEEPIKIGGVKAMTLSEQSIRKAGSILSIRSDGKAKTFLPPLHRGKDILDFPQIEKTLIKSEKTSLLTVRIPERVSKVEHEIELLNKIKIVGEQKLAIIEGKSIAIEEPILDIYYKSPITKNIGDRIHSFSMPSVSSNIPSSFSPKIGKGSISPSIISNIPKSSFGSSFVSPSKKSYVPPSISMPKSISPVGSTGPKSPSPTPPSLSPLPSSPNIPSPGGYAYSSIVSGPSPYFTPFVIKQKKQVVIQDFGFNIPKGDILKTIVRKGKKRGFRFAPTLGGLAVGKVGRLPKGRRYTGFEVRLPTMKAPPL